MRVNSARFAEKFGEGSSILPGLDIFCYLAGMVEVVFKY